MLKLTSLIVTALFISQNSFATPPAIQFNCTVSKVIDGGEFEDVNGFEFKDYPNISYVGVSENGKSLTVGALTFSEKDSTQPSVITEETEQRMTIIVAEPEDSGQIFSVAVNDNQGMLYYYSEEADGPSEVAELICNQ